MVKKRELIQVKILEDKAGKEGDLYHGYQVQIGVEREYVELSHMLAARGYFPNLASFLVASIRESVAEYAKKGDEFLALAKQQSHSASGNIP